MVYSRGLRRCLIIFAPHTLILDRRTGTCRTPSLLVISQRSKNFTSGVAVSFTPRCSIEGDRRQPAGHAGGAPAPHGGGGASLRHRGLDQAPRHGHQGQHNSIATYGRCFDIPWTDIQPCGRLEHTEFSTVSETVDSGGGLRETAQVRGRAPRSVNTQALGIQPQRSPLKKTWSRSHSHRHGQRVQEHTAGGCTSAGATQPPPASRRRPCDPRLPPSRPATQHRTTSVLTTAMLVYALGAGITAAAGTRLALQSILITVFGLHPLQAPPITEDRWSCCGSSLPRQIASAWGNLRACCPP